MQHSTEVQSILDQCTIEDKVVRLPEGQLERSLYMKVAKAIDGIGGKWNRAVNGFLFKVDPAELMGRVQNGEVINLKKDYQFFETPNDLADRLVEMAMPLPQDRVLEPSAGLGAIIKAIHRENPKQIVYAYELFDQNRMELERMDFVKVLGDDFLSGTPGLFDVIIMNPPFSNNQDIDHCYKAFELLSDGGRLVCIMSQHWTFAQELKCFAFRQFLEKVNAEVFDLQAGAFASSGTNVRANIVVIEKR